MIRVVNTLIVDFFGQKNTSDLSFKELNHRIIMILISSFNRAAFLTWLNN